MSLCVLRATSLVHERIACTKLSPARLIHHNRKHKFESFSSLWSTPVSSIVDHITTAPVKAAPELHTLHNFHCSPVASTCSCHSLMCGACTTSDQTLKKTVRSVFIRNISDAPDIPPDKRLDSKQVAELVKNNEVLLIDVRSRTEVKATGLLPKTINIPAGEYGTAMKIPDDIFKQKYGFDKPKQDDPIVFICTTGIRSYRALRTALQMGYKNFSTSARCYEVQTSGPSVKISPDKHLSYDDLVNLIARKEIYLVDVREPHELQETGELPGSTNIPLNELGSALKDLSDIGFQKKYGAKKPGQNAPLVFSCRSGARSLKALQLALDLGYLKAKHYKGGYLDWEEHTKSKTKMN